MVIISKAHIFQAKLLGACSDELSRVRVGMPVERLSQTALSWLSSTHLWTIARATELAGESTDIVGCIPMGLFARSGSGDGYGYGDGSGYGNGVGSGYGNGNGVGSGLSISDSPHHEDATQ